MPDPSTIALSEQIDALAARVAMLERRQERLVRALKDASRHLDMSEPNARDAGYDAQAAESEAVRHEVRRQARIRELTAQEEEVRLEQERVEAIHDLTRRVVHLESAKS